MKKRRQAIIPTEWIEHVITKRGPEDSALLHAAVDFYADKSPQLLENGLSVADILLGLGLDTAYQAPVPIKYPRRLSHFRAIAGIYPHKNQRQRATERNLLDHAL